MSRTAVRKKRTPLTSNKVTMFTILCVVVIVMLVLFVKETHLSKKVEANTQRISEVEQQIEDENQRTEEIQDLQAYMQSDEYLEETAKEKLGLVKEGEIIFKEAE